MRLNLIIQRHGLPIVRILWTTTPSTTGLTARPPATSSAIASARAPNAFCDNGGLTIAQLLEDINEVIPLESGEGAARQGPGQWGLEDYVVEVNGFECLHFMEVEGLLRDGDEVVIRPLSPGDMRARRLSGRVQITNDGRHLVDGVPFGRPYLKRSFPVRPPVRIPSRKRRCVTLDGWNGDDRRDAEEEDAEEEEDDDYEPGALVDNSVLSSGTVVRHPIEYDDDDESDASFEPDAEDVAAELEDLKRDQAEEPARPPSGHRSRATRRSSSAESVAHADEVAEASVSPKSKAVHFEDREESGDSTVESAAEDSSVEESSDSETDVTSPSTSDSDTESDSEVESESESESISDSDSSSDSESSESERESPQPPPKKPQRFVPPGQGSSRTKRTNQRNRRRRKLAKLKQLGYLHPEANFADLRKWEEENEQNGSRVLTDVAQQEARTADKEKAEFEARRERLLRQLASGGIDVDAQSEKENVPPQQANGVISDQIEETVQRGKRRRLDVQSSKRLLFGSLGVKTPMSREEEEATRKKLAGTPRTVQPPVHEQPEQEPESDVDENWQDKLTVMATECVHENVHIEPPPFPFKQRWDAEAQQAIQNLKWRRGHSRRKRKSQGREQEAEEETHLDYDEPNHDVTTATEGETGNAEDDLPQLPEDPSTLPDLTEDAVKPNSVIAYKILEMSKATSWQPQISAYKVARIDHILDDGQISLCLAKRDREQRETTTDEDGVREYSGFEMPGYENEVDAEDDGIRTLSFSELIEPKLVVPANDTPQEQHVAGVQDDNNGDKTVPERSPQPSPANAQKESTTREPDVELSSQMRNDISQIIHDAGFRSTIDSDQKLQEDPPVQRDMDMDDDGGPLPPDDLLPASFEAEEPHSRVAEASSKATPGAASVRNKRSDDVISRLKEDDFPTNLSPADSSASEAATAPDAEKEDAIPDENDSSVSSPSLPKVQSPFEESPQRLCSDVFEPSSSPPPRPVRRNLSKWFKRNDDSQDTQQKSPSRKSNSPGESPRITADDVDKTNSRDESESAEEDAVQTDVHNDDVLMDDPTPTSYQPPRAPTEEPDEGASVQPDLPSQTRDSQLDSPRRSSQPSRSQTPDRPIMELSSSDRSGDSIVWNPFYEKDRGKYDLAEDEPPFPSTEPPPARHDDSSSTTRRTRKAKRATLSSPRQLSNSNSSAFVTPPDRRSTPRKPTEPDPDATPTRGKPRQDQPRSSIPPDESQVVDLTLSSPLQSPSGSDEDFAKSLGLPTGPGWIRKNVRPTERQTRSSSRALGRVGTASASPSQRRSRAST